MDVSRSKLADVASAGNSTRGWTLESRDDGRIRMAIRRVAMGGLSHRQWRQGQQFSAAAVARWLAPSPLAVAAREPFEGAAPMLRFGYRPEVVVFLAEGAPPFALLAGSVRAWRLRRAVAATGGCVASPSVAATGSPLTATLGTRQALAGDAAFAAAEAPHDWKRWLLWGVLVAGAAAGGGLRVQPVARQTRGLSAGLRRPRAGRDNGGLRPAAGMPMSIVRMTDLDLAGKRVLIRQDLNVPVADGKVTSEQRITASLPTMQAGAREGRGGDGDLAPGPTEGRQLERGRFAGAGGRAPVANCSASRCRWCATISTAWTCSPAKSCCWKTAG